MKKVVVLMTLSATVSLLQGQYREPQLAPLNPEFVRYMEMLERGEIKIYTSDGHGLGYVPHPVKFKAEIPANFQKNLSLPEAYDLRTAGLVTPVKDQSTCGCCWAFASMGAVESRWLALGLGEFDLSENNLKNGHGYTRGHCSGGNYIYSTSYFTRGDGPVSEADDPFDENDDTYIPDLTLQGYIPDARFLPNDMAVLKQTIYDYGAVLTNMYYDDSYYNSSNDTYYFDGSDTTLTNHAILLAGWDDNKVTDGGTGVWIIKNSWGTDFGENGYFYISYNDTKINSDLAFWPNRIDYNPSATVYYYDKLGATGAYGYTSNGNPIPTGYGLVKFVPSEDQQITKVGSWISSSNSTVNFTIYDNFNGNSLANLLGSIGDQSCDYPGYYTFDLTNSIAVNGGDDFFIKVKYYSPGEAYPIPLEMVGGYANPDIETGKCWVSYNGQNGEWNALGTGTGNEYDLCIKAYGVSTTSVDQQLTGSSLPTEMILYQNNPNPFNPKTTISYSLPSSRHVILKVYDTLGHEIAKLIDERKETGVHKVEFDAGDLSTGVYFYRIKAGEETQTKKLTVLK